VKFNVFVNDSGLSIKIQFFRSCIGKNQFKLFNPLFQFYQNDPTQSGNATIQQILKENQDLKFKIAKLEQIDTDKMLKVINDQAQKLEDLTDLYAN
jgi:hypothetical protein